MLVLTNCRGVLVVLGILGIVTTVQGSHDHGHNHTEHGHSVDPRAMPFLYRDFCDLIVAKSLPTQMQNMAGVIKLPIVCLPHLFFSRSESVCQNCTTFEFKPILPDDFPITGTGGPPPGAFPGEGSCIAYGCGTGSLRPCTCIGVSDTGNSDSEFCNCDVNCNGKTRSNNKFATGRAFGFGSPATDCIFTIKVKNRRRAGNVDIDFHCDCKIVGESPSCACHHYKSGTSIYFTNSKSFHIL